MADNFYAFDLSIAQAYAVHPKLRNLNDAISGDDFLTFRHDRGVIANGFEHGPGKRHESSPRIKDQIHPDQASGQVGIVGMDEDGYKEFLPSLPLGREYVVPQKGANPASTEGMSAVDVVTHEFLNMATSRKSA